jgi:hypothetical protein
MPETGELEHARTEALVAPGRYAHEGGMPVAAPRRWSLAPLLAGVALASWCVPASAWTSVVEPSSRAMVALVAVVAVMFVLRTRGKRGAQLEKGLLCVFLACMPWIYLESGLRHDGGGWLIVESAGQLAFAVWAWLAYARRTEWLAAGILAHGVLWDSWHHDSHYIAGWYAVACLIVDVGLAAYIALERARLAAAT